MGVDPVLQAGDPQLLNRYAYVRNEPINKIDPTGKNPLDITAYQMAAMLAWIQSMIPNGASATPSGPLPETVTVVATLPPEEFVDFNFGGQVPGGPSSTAQSGNPEGQGGGGSTGQTTPSNTDELTPLHCDPGFIETSRRAWMITGNGGGLNNIHVEAGFWVTGSTTVPHYNSIIYTNEESTIRGIPMPPNRVAFVHTHPNVRDPHPSRGDVDAVRQARVPFYVLSNRGLWVRRPGATRSERLRPGLSWINPCPEEDE